MSSSHRKVHAHEVRIHELEMRCQWLAKALEISASLGDFQACVNQGMDPAAILSETRVRLQQMFEFRAIAFLLVDEKDQAFSLSDCEPGTERDYIQAEIDHHIEEGTFAWALNQTRAVLAQTQDGRYTLVFHVLATRSRIRGMFVGLLAEEMVEVKESVLNLFSIIFFATANALESYELYQFVKEQKSNLEVIVSQRTRQLEEARAEAEEANKAKSQFLANMSHEIRTPLTAIIGYAEALRHDDMSESEKTEAVDIITRAGRHLQDIINDILDLSKIESNHLETELVPTDPMRVLAEIDALMSIQAGEKGLGFSIHYEFPLPTRVVTDPTRLRQILLNLCGNAVKFTHTGEVCVTVSYRLEAAQMVFTVTDTGIGLSPEQQQRLFRPFTQADQTTTRHYGGTGLGLAISKQLAEKLGGSITVRSALGEGSSFTVVIAAAVCDAATWVHSLEQDDSTATEAASSDSVAAVPRLSGRVLLAEDNMDNQRLITMFLNNAGIEASVVTNGRLAVEQALAGDFDLILMDMQMPEMDGIEATKLLRAAGYGRPIITLTANATADDRDRCRAVGCDAFLTKPIDRNHFYRTLSRYLAKSAQADDSTHVSGISDEYRAIVARFVRGLPERVEEMAHLFRHMQWEQLKSAAHQLKGSASNMGYPELGEVAARIERGIGTLKQAELSSVMDRLGHLSRRIIATAANDFQSDNGPVQANEGSRHV